MKNILIALVTLSLLPLTSVAEGINSRGGLRNKSYEQLPPEMREKLQKKGVENAEDFERFKAEKKAKIQAKLQTMTYADAPQKLKDRLAQKGVTNEEEFKAWKEKLQQKRAGSAQ